MFPRMYLLVREDLLQGSAEEIVALFGKWMIQSGHAFSQALMDTPPHISQPYCASAEHAKIALRVPNEEALHEFRAACVEHGIVYHVQTDLAHTVFTEPTTTCIATRPIEKHEYDLLGLKKFKRL